MSEISLNRKTFADLKDDVHARLPHVKSSHLAEALAFSLGFQTYAALLTAIATPAGRGPRTPYSDLFMQRLQRFGYDIEPDVDLGFSFDMPTLKLAPENLLNLSNPDFSEPWLFNKSPLERCHDYGVQIVNKGPGKMFAAHNVGGWIGPFDTEDQAANEACAKWNI